MLNEYKERKLAEWDNIVSHASGMYEPSKEKVKQFISDLIDEISEKLPKEKYLDTELSDNTLEMKQQEEKVLSGINGGNSCRETLINNLNKE